MRHETTTETFPGHVKAMCSCGWIDRWYVADGSAEQSAYAHRSRFERGDEDAARAESIRRVNLRQRGAFDGLDMVSHGAAMAAWQAERDAERIAELEAEVALRVLAVLDEEETT